MADRRMPWFPVNPIDGLTQSRFTSLTATEMGHVFRSMMYWWLHGQMPAHDDEMLATASDRSRAVAEAWITEIHAKQVEKFNAVSERNRENASKTRSMKSETSVATASDGKRPLATVSHREGEREGERKNNITTTTKPPKGDVTFPEWWNPALQQVWSDFAAFRGKKFNGPYTMGKLTRLRKAGHDPLIVLRQSLENGWQGLFEVKENADGRQRSDMDRATEFFANRLQAAGEPKAEPLGLPGGGEDAYEPEPDISF